MQEGSLRCAGSECLDDGGMCATAPHEITAITTTFSRLFALINAAVESRGGVLKKVTYHIMGSDVMIYFGVPNAHTNDPQRAAGAVNRSGGGT